MNSNYNDVIKSAMEDYLSNTNNSYDDTRLKEFAGEAISVINECINANKITGFLLFIAPLIIINTNSIIFEIIICIVAIFSAIQEGHYIRTKKIDIN